jgi:hypothetical protein
MPEQKAQEERVLRLLHGVRNLRGLTPEQVRRIASRLDAAVVPVRRRSLLPVLAILALLLSAGTAVAWTTGTLRRFSAVRALFTSTRIARRPPSVAMPGAAVRPIEIAAPKEQVPTADLEELEASKPPRREDSPASVPHGRRRASNAPAARAARQEPEASKLPATTPLMPDNLARNPGTGSEPPAMGSLEPSSSSPDANPIAREGESFANVLRSWRRDHDGRAALSALDLHDRGFARGQMALESRLLRVEILLSEGRDREALALLDRLALGKGNVPRGRELLTVRGELRIKAGRCDDGRADLASIEGGTDGFAERARNALTYCR